MAGACFLISPSQGHPFRLIGEARLYKRDISRLLLKTYMRILESVHLLP